MFTQTVPTGLRPAIRARAVTAGREDGTRRLTDGAARQLERGMPFRRSLWPEAAAGGNAKRRAPLPIVRGWERRLAEKGIPFTPRVRAGRDGGSNRMKREPPLQNRHASRQRPASEEKRTWPGE